MTKQFICSDTDPLKKVLIHSPANEIQHIMPKFGFLGKPGYSADILGKDAINQHKLFTKLLNQNDIECMQITDCINNALANLEHAHKLEEWIKQNFPLLTDLKDITATDLMGASDRVFYTTNEAGEHIPLTEPLHVMYYVRDGAVVLPEGVIICSFGNKRSTEIKLVRLIFEWSDQLKDIPIIFDAEKENVNIQGGDIIVLDHDTLLIGVDNMTSREAAVKIAKKLNKTVIGIKLAAAKPDKNKTGTPFSSLFLHLDTVFNLIDKKKALITPYFFESKFRDTNPIYAILNGATYDVDNKIKEDVKNITAELAQIGNVTIFEKNTGASHETGLKLVDYLRSNLNFQLIYVGGEIPTTQTAQKKHLLETVIPEIRFQAGNIVAINPGEVLIYQSNTEQTQKALADAGVKLHTFVAPDLARWNGGPHCMTLPIERF